MSRFLAFTLLFSVLFSQALFAAKFQSSATRTHLIELYTSEGCSSCPPADAYLKTFKKEPGLWKDFIAVGFHVTYWDYIGWQDPYGSEAFTIRQRQYAQFWKSRSVYTPAFVLNGSEWKEWHQRRGVPKPSNELVGILSIEAAENSNYHIHFMPSSGLRAKWNAHLSLLAFDEASEVKSGENRGKRLSHEFVVLDLQTRPMERDGNEFHQTLRLELPKEEQVTRYGVAAWVTRQGDMRPVQAVGGYL